MKSVAMQVIRERRAHPVDKKDLVNAFIHGRDAKTGESLSDDNIANNMITFLVAGKDTDKYCSDSIMNCVNIFRSRNYIWTLVLPLCMPA